MILEIETQSNMKDQKRTDHISDSTRGSSHEKRKFREEEDYELELSRKSKFKDSHTSSPVQIQAEPPQEFHVPSTSWDYDPAEPTEDDVNNNSITTSATVPTLDQHWKQEEEEDNNVVPTITDSTEDSRQQELLEVIKERLRLFARSKHHRCKFSVVSELCCL